MYRHEQPQEKGVQPVPNQVLINFLYWLRTYHYPEMQQLADLSNRKLLALIHEFESHRPDVDFHKDQAWTKGVGLFLDDDPSYADALEVFFKIK